MKPSDSVYKALKVYYSKIKNISMFATDGDFCKLSAEMQPCYKNHRYLLEREQAVHFDEITKKFGITIPNVIQSYFQYCHPSVIGMHKKSPYPNDFIVLNSAITQEKIMNLILTDMEYWEKYPMKDLNTQDYFPIGSVMNFDSFVVLERNTGKIWIEYGMEENPADDAEGKLYPIPLAKNLATFIRELKPY